MGMDLMHTIGQRGANPILTFIRRLRKPAQAAADHPARDARAGHCSASCSAILAFRSRVNGVYLSIITQAMTYALMLAFFRDDMGFGGNTGLNDFQAIAGFPIDADGTRAFLFALTALVLAASLIG